MPRGQGVISIDYSEVASPHRSQFDLTSFHRLRVAVPVHSFLLGRGISLSFSPCLMKRGRPGIAVSLLVCVIEIPRMQSIVSDRESSDMVAVGVTDSKPLPQPEVSVRRYFT